ncbi:MAG: proline dehydrogenase family protein [Lentimicrobiaceae bacterium]|jgi:proline dehydrogenase
MLSFENTEIAFRYKSNADLRRARILFGTLANPGLVKIGKSLTYFALNMHLPFAWFIKATLYKHFVGGETLGECEKTVQLLSKFNVKSILDYSVEGGKDHETMQRTLDETLRSVIHAAKHPDIPFSVFKPTAFASQQVLTLASENTTIDSETVKEIQYFKDSVEKLCKTAFENDIPIMIDAEDSWYQPFVDQVVTEMMEKYNKQKAIVYNTLQMYRTDRLDFLKESLRKAEEGNYYLGIKFVRGAYMEKERLRAAEKGYPSPIQPDKAATDQNYDAGVAFTLAHLDRISVFSGSHNEKSNRLLTELMEKQGLARNENKIWFSQLYGMSDHISFNLADEGYNVTKYIPYGPVRNILPYLIRRAEENTSIAGQTGRELALLERERLRRKKS